MMQELKKDHVTVQEAYESALAEDGLVSKINGSSLQPAEKGTLLALFEQAGRVIYSDKAASFSDQLEHPLRQLHDPSLLYDSSVFMHLTMDAMQKLTSQYDDPELNEHTDPFYVGIQKSIQKYLPKDFSVDINSLMHEFYNWHIRPTMSAARQIGSSTFKGKLKQVRDEMQEIEQALIRQNEYENVVTHASNVLKIISTDYIDQKYVGDRPKRPFLVNLYAGAYLLNSMAEKGKDLGPGSKNTLYKRQLKHKT